MATTALSSTLATAQSRLARTEARAKGKLWCRWIKVSLYSSVAGVRVDSESEDRCCRKLLRRSTGNGLHESGSFKCVVLLWASALIRIKNILLLWEELPLPHVIIEWRCRKWTDFIQWKILRFVINLSVFQGMQFLSVTRVTYLRASAPTDTTAPRVRTSTPVHGPHASTIPRVQMWRVLSTSAFVNQDIQVRSILQSQLCFITVLRLI